jgi:competence protein ComEC
LRNVAVSALLVLAVTPEAAIGPSFQMSFAAVVALVAWYENRRGRSPASATTWFGRAGRWLFRYIGAAVVTTLLAGFATAPSAAFHFQRLSVYALAANIGALPLISLVIMPAVVIGTVLMPFGLDAFPWQVMGWGVDGMMAVAHTVAGWPGASRHVVAFGPGAMMLMTLGLLWLALFSTRLRWFGAAPALLGLWLAAVAQPPDLYIGPEGQALAVRGPDWRLHVIGVRFASFATDEWLAADGDGRSHRDPTIKAGVLCDPYGCTAPLTDGHRVALDWTYAALRTDCSRAEIVVTSLAAPADCGADIVIDGADLAARGAITLAFTADGPVERDARPSASTRRWYNRPAPPMPVPGFAPPPAAPPTTASGGESTEDTDAGGAVLDLPNLGG